MKNTRPHTLILGIGNILLGDEGFGVRVIEHLGQYSLPAGIELADGGTGGIGLVELIAEREMVIVVDAIDAGKPAATILRLEPKDILNPQSAALSVHHLNLPAILHTAKILNRQPKQVVIFGVQPHTIAAGMELSPAVQPLVAVVAGLILDHLGITPPRR